MNSESWITPDWPAPRNVRSLLTTRNGGVSQGMYSSLNMSLGVGDDPVAVQTNRARVRELLPNDPVWLEQVHGFKVVEASAYSAQSSPAQADAAFSRQTGVVCVVMTADCLPVLFCDISGNVVAAAHAGWRGLLAGILEATVSAMEVPGKDIMAYLGPAIGSQFFEVGDEVRSAFVSADNSAAQAFKPCAPNKWLANIYLLAHLRLAKQGIDKIFGGSSCTLSEADRFFSYRRDGQTGRMASMIWLEQQGI